MSDPTARRELPIGFRPDLLLWLGLVAGMLLMAMVVARLDLQLPEALQAGSDGQAGGDESAAQSQEELLALVLDEGGNVAWEFWASSLGLLLPLGLLWLTFSRWMKPQAPPPALLLWRDLMTIALGWVFFHLAGQVVVFVLRPEGGVLAIFEIELLAGLATALLMVFLARMRGLIRRMPGGVRELLGAPASARNVWAGLAAYLWTLPLLFAVLVAVTVLSSRLGFENPSQSVGLLVGDALRAGGWSSLSVVLFVAVAAPLSEELFFRGILQRRLRGWSFAFAGREFTVGPLLAALVSALLFTLLHTEPSGFSPFQLLILLLGLLLAALYERTGDVRVTFAVHAAHNSANLILLMAQQQ